MSIGYRKQSAASVPTPPAGEMNTFIDIADDKIKRKDSTGTVFDIEEAAAGVNSFNGRSGVVVPVAGDYDASEITNTPAGDIVSTNVQAAINELDTEKAPIGHVGSTGVSQHGIATGSVAGFMSPSDKTKIDNLATVASTGNKSDIGLGNVDNTSDANKPVSTAQGAAIAVVQSDIDVHEADIGNPHNVTKAQVGLGNADNTSDANKPVSTAQAAADAAVQAYAIARANHTGTQVAATISDFTSAADARVASGIAAHVAQADPHAQYAMDSDVTAAIAYSVARANHTGTQVASTISDFDEAAQDAVGNALVDTATIDMTYDDTANQIKADVKDNSIGTVKLIDANVTKAKIAASAIDDSKVDAAAAIALTKLAALGTHNRVLISDNTGVITESGVSNTTLAFLDATSSIQTQLNAKVAKAGDTMTGNLNVPAVAITGTAGAGYTELPAQSSPPSTPVSGIRMYASSLGKFAWKGVNGFQRIFDGSANTADRTYTLPDANVTLMADPTTTNGDIITRIAGLVARLGIGTEAQVLTVSSGLAAWADPNIKRLFGGGGDGNITVSGIVTLTQNTYYDVVTMVAGGQIVTGGYSLYCNKLDLTNADANCINWNGTDGLNATTQTGAANGVSQVNAVLGGGGNGGNGATGVVGAGAVAAAVTTSSPSNGGAGGRGGKGGTGLAGTNAGGALRVGGTVSNPVTFDRFEDQFLRGGTLINGGAGGAGGSSGAGDGTVTGGGGGGGGNAGGVCAIFAYEIVTGASTPAGVIRSSGGKGGNGGKASPTGQIGGGGGAGGGGGGYLYIAYVKRTGPTVTNGLNANGGNGGNGGNGAGTGVGGDGAYGGDGGRVRLFNATANTSTFNSGNAGSAGSAGSGTTGGTGGLGGTCMLNL